MNDNRLSGQEPCGEDLMTGFRNSKNQLRVLSFAFMAAVLMSPVSAQDAKKPPESRPKVI
jgi:hypothetical protein